MDAKLVRLHELSQFLFAKNHNEQYEFVVQLINEHKWKLQNGFKVQEFRSKDDYFEIYYVEAGKEIEYFECDVKGNISKIEIYCRSIDDWKSIEISDSEKKLYPARFKNLKNQLAEVIEDYMSDHYGPDWDRIEPDYMLEAKERKAGII